MPLMTNTDIQSRFPNWEKYCTVANSPDTPETYLDRVVLESDAELQHYIDVDDTTIDEFGKLQLMNIIRYRCFLLKHGDTEFKVKPRIVEDYENTLKILKRAQSRGLPTITAKPRLFGPGKWFTKED